MRNLLCLVIIMVCALTLNAQMPSQCTLSPNLVTNYKDDVAYLALQRIYLHNSTYKDSIEIPASYQDSIWAGLSAIYNLNGFAERDSVFDKYCIHQFCDQNTNHDIMVGLDMSCTWLSQWQSSNINTGVPALDSLLSDYSFTITYYSSFFKYAIITTPYNLNDSAICDSILTFSGVINATPDVCMGDGNSINYSVSGNDKYYDFNINYGFDCPSGCTSHRTYKFKVLNTCYVDYLGTIDMNLDINEFPLPSNCNITTVNENLFNSSNIKLFPNPANDIVNIDVDEKATLEIINIQGQIVDSKSLTEKVNNLDLSNLESGVYTLRIKTDRGIAMRKLIKQ